MIQLILHLLGDYVTQSDEMANRKTTSSWWAFAHALTYSLPFLLIASLPAWSVIIVTHFFIDRFRLARHVCWFKNIVFGLWMKRLFTPVPPFGTEQWDAHVREHMDDTERFMWANCSGTGYPSERPPWLAVWLLIAADNTLHLAINALAIGWLN